MLASESSISNTLPIQIVLSYPAGTWSFISGITASFSGVSIAFSLLHSIKRFVFRSKSTILQPLLAVSGVKLEDVPIFFWWKQELFPTHNLFSVEGKGACSFIEISTDLHGSDKKENNLSCSAIDKIKNLIALFPSSF